MVALTPEQKALLAALARAQAQVPKGQHKGFLTASSFSGVAVILPDGVNLPLDMTDLNELVDAGFVKITAHRDHGDVNGFVTSAGSAFLEVEATHSVQSASRASVVGASNVKRSASVFYSWQSDISPGAACRSLIEGALNESAKRVAGDSTLDVEPVIDRDTANVPGAPDIGTTILAKIESAAVFVADVTIVGRTDSGKPTPNPNVLIELGYALHALGPSRVILVQNAAMGGPEMLPFDLRQRRVLVFNSPPDATDRATERRALAGRLEVALREMLKAPPLHHPAVELAISSKVKSVEGGVHHCELIGAMANKGTKRFDDWEVEIEFPTQLMEPSVIVAIKVDSQSDARRSLFRTGHERLRVPLRSGEERRVALGFRVDQTMLAPGNELLAHSVKIRAFVDGALAAELDRSVESVLPPELRTSGAT